MSAIFGFTFHIGRMTEVLTPDIYRAHCPVHDHSHRDYKRIEWAFRSKSRDKLKHLMGAKSRSLIG